jgi:Xaa-Pro dipeptidase
MMTKVPAEEIAARIVALQRLLDRNDIEAAIIRQNADLFYFTGTVQDAHLIVPASGRPVFLVKRNVQRAEFQSPIRPILPLSSVKDVPRALFDACGTESIKRIGMELDVLPTTAFFFYDEKLFPKQQIVDVSGMIRQVRMVKSPWEIEMMRVAADRARLVAEAVPRVLKEGMSELELSIELERVARLAGHLGVVRLRAFNMDMYFGHVLSGPEAAIPAYTDAPTGGEGLSASFGQGPNMRPIRRGETVSVDTMMNYQGYLNDQTRIFSIGAPPARLAEAYAMVCEIHRRFKILAKPGAVTGDLYAEVLRWVEEAGWGEFFMGHGETRVSFIAHGLGIEVDEFPFIAYGHKLPLEEGMTFAFEPKMIMPGEGIVGLENVYLVTRDGLQSLNTAAEELVVL